LNLKNFAFTLLLDSYNPNLSLERRKKKKKKKKKRKDVFVYDEKFESGDSVIVQAQIITI